MDEKRVGKTGIECARDFANLVLLERELKERLAEVETKKKPLAEVVQNFLLESGLKNLPFDDLGITLYTHSMLWATPRDGSEHGEILDALEACGWTEVLHYNANRLSAMVRESIKEGHPLPGELEALIEVKETTKLRAKKT